MTNPLLSPSTLPYGLTPFAELTPRHYREAVLQGLQEQRAELEAIVEDPAGATFANTVLALEASGRLLDRALRALDTVAGADGSPELDAVETEVTPLLAAHRDGIYLNDGLYRRFAAVDAGSLAGEDLRLLEEYLREFRLAGIDLGAGAQERLKAVNTRLSALGTEFAQKAKEAVNAGALVVDTEEELRGLDADAIRSAAQSATDAGHEGKYLIPLIQPSSQPALSVLEKPRTRAALLRNSLARGTQDDTLDVRANILEQVALRAEKAELLGFENYAELAVQDQTAPGLRPVLEMLRRMAPSARANAGAEAAYLAVSAGGPITAADWQFHSDRVRAERFQVDEQELRAYFELNTVIEHGIFAAAGRLFGLRFTERFDLPAYHPDVRAWEVFEEDGSPLGLFLGDYFTRPSKRGGAWMNSLVEQSTFAGTHPVVFNTLNVARPAEGEPALLTLDELRTVFHEFGHALHGLLSRVKYPKLSGANVPRDFVEYPSQVNEMWMFDPEILAGYARHHETGEPLDPAVLGRLEDAALWGQGFGTMEYLGAALLDLAWHSFGADSVPADVEAFEQSSLEAAGLAWELVPPRYRSGYFQHIFAGGWYAAGYYSYIWSEVLDADTVEWFRENGGLSRDNGEHFRAELLSRGNSRDPLTSFRAFRGRDADVAPLLKRRGLA
ncbi:MULTISPECIES: M3 family metallopeptidase [Arthrobacter]|uniref:M3 family metallopeptidase n=2 Tax=Arthrobacter TaxID=1663 RepID=A0ABU9KHP9_9MICC|nr:M3 family metallopeptidase [Arthrobacter sp. YJM1]MDP5226081.1 M3 family metallopeptidase [Arthrobacter sp. YJM1]